MPVAWSWLTCCLPADDSCPVRQFVEGLPRNLDVLAADSLHMQPRSEMRANGIDQLAVLGGSWGSAAPAAGSPLYSLLEAARLDRFALAYPDQAGWLVRLGSELKCSNISTHISLMLYEGRPPELLSMYCCLCMAGSLGLFSVQCLDYGAARAAVSAYSRKHGIPPHPRQLLQLLQGAESVADADSHGAAA